MRLEEIGWFEQLASQVAVWSAAVPEQCIILLK